MNKILLKLSLMVLNIACINTVIHAAESVEKPSVSESIQSISNGGFKYYYRYGVLDLAIKELYWNGSGIYIEFENNRLKKLTLNSTNFQMYSFVYAGLFTCDELYNDMKDCDKKNIYQQDQDNEEYPELRKNDPINIEEFLESRSDSEGWISDDLDLFLGTVALNLKANHFSDDFIQHVVMTAKESEKHPPTEKKLKLLKEEEKFVFEALGIDPY